MKYILFTLTLGLLIISTNAQRPPEKRPRNNEQAQNIGDQPMFDRKPNRGSIEMFKIKFITDQLALTAQEAEAFWPIYNEYKKNIHAIYKEKKDNEIEMQEATLATRKKLAAALKPILKSDSRINDALKVEKDFFKKAKNEMMHRRGGPPPRST